MDSKHTKCFAIAHTFEEKDLPRSQAHPVKQHNNVPLDSKVALPNFSADDIARLQHLLQALRSSTTSFDNTFSQALHYTGIPTCLHSVKQPTNTWILDSGATNHMTYSTEFFETYLPCTNPKKLLTANGSTADILGQGNISFS